MKFKYLKAAFAGMVFSASCLVNVANAGLITETYKGEVIYSDGSLSLGEMLSWTFTYDNTKNTATNWQDGLDGLSYTADDIINVGHFPFHSFVSDVTFDLNQFDTLFDSSASALGYIANRQIDNSGNSHYLTNTFGSRITSNFDGYGVRLDFPNNALTLNKSFFNVDDGSRKEFNIQVANLTKVDLTKVPEPSTLAIFALGMMGIASRRFKKQS